MGLVGELANFLKLAPNSKLTHFISWAVVGLGKGLQLVPLEGVCLLEIGRPPHPGSQSLQILRMTQVLGVDDGHVKGVPGIQAQAAFALGPSTMDHFLNTEAF